MLSIEECRKILNINGTKYTDEEIKKIRDLLYYWAEIEFDNYKNNKSLEKT